MGAAAAQSTPYLGGFDPRAIPYQWEALSEVRTFDYSKGSLEMLFSGSYGSAKSILMAHIAVTHCLFYPRARVCLGRKSMPDLKRTIFKEILEHIAEDLVDGRDYWVNQTNASIVFSNGSEIVSTSWADKKYKRPRSLKLSGVLIEELTESNDEDMAAFLELKARVRRLPHVPENFVICASNPDSPSHWAYKYFIEPTLDAAHATRRVYYSNTFDNPFLDPQYIEQLRRDLDPKLARRYIYGEWIEIATEVVYHAYDRTKNFRDVPYVVDEALPIHLSWDFNIGEGKPLSVSVFQYNPRTDEFHFFAEVVVEGMRTADSCEELAARGLLDYRTHYVINGDASGKHKDTRSKRSDYEIIEHFMANREGLSWSKFVPLANPPVRERHNRMNAYFCNAEGRHRAFVYRGCDMHDKGFRLVALKKGGNYIEDDSKAWQHVTTSASYGVHAALMEGRRQRQGTIQL